MKRTALITLAAIAAVFPFISAARSGSSTRRVAILYSASAVGQIRSCNCTKFRFGGYGRELTLLKAIRGEQIDTVLIEGGDMVEWTGFLSPFKTEFACRAIKLLGYQAFVPGENEIGRGGARSIESTDPESPPVVCANYIDPERKTPPFRSWVPLKTASGLRVGIIGLVSQSVGRSFQAEEFSSFVTDPVAALNKVLPGVRAKSDLVIVVYHGPLAEAEETIAVKGVDLVLATHRTERKVLFPEKGENEIEAPVTNKSGVIVANAETHENWSLGRIDLEIEGASRIASAKHRLLYLDRAYPEDPEMVAVYEQYNSKVKDAVLGQANDFKKKAEAMLTSRGLNLTEMRKRLRVSELVTAKKCAECHAEIYESWSKTQHARAMQTLEKTHQEYDPECVTCHSTGVLVRNGFTNMRDTPELANVQCEACHGPGRKHTEFRIKGYVKADEQKCRACHSDERTPDFDFDSAWAKIKH